MRRFIECLIPTTKCNLKCSYCYLIQEGRRKNEKALFKYDTTIIKKALSVDRLGGVSLISITASGETLSVLELPDIVRGLLENGHYVNITTNGTMFKQLSVLLKKTEGLHGRLHFSFSWHYVELLKHNLLDTFFECVKLARDSGGSILLQINLADEYLPYWDEIKRLSIENCGALPQVALTRKEGKPFVIYTELPKDEYIRLGREMNSPLFDFTSKFFMEKRREYCYAGLWSGKLNLCTGELSGCYGRGIRQNIFEDVTKPIKWMPIGKHCPFMYCFNSSHFISQGIIPELEPQPSYAELRNREEAKWYNNDMKSFLSTKMMDENPQLSTWNKAKYEMMYYCVKLGHIIERLKR